MFYKVVTPALIATLLAFLILGSAETGRAQKGGEIKISMLAPRESTLFKSFTRLSDQVSKASNGTWKVRSFPAGVAGDERDVVRKMQIGQLDGAVMTVTGLSIIEPQMAILDAPGLIGNYAQMEAVQKETDKIFEEMLLKKNLKLITWWEGGQLRFFSKGRVGGPEDLRTHREWLWPDSYIMKELWRAAGATGVPLGMIDVFGALQTGMVDMVINTAIAVVQLRWHTALDHVTARPSNVLLFAWVMDKKKWDAIPPNVQKAILDAVPSTRAQMKVDARKGDDEAYQSLLKRGYKAVVTTPQETAALDALFEKVCAKLTGRLWPAALYEKIKAITTKVK
jgi:TRAP-type C4-dicarboxylate transport system substrate-binding protein